MIPPTFVWGAGHSEQQQETALGDLYTRRQSRVFNDSRQPDPPGPNWSDTSTDLPLRRYTVEQQADADAMGLTRPEEIHLRPHLAPWNTPRDRASSIDRPRPRDLEAGIWLTRREKGEWAMILVCGSLSICALIALIVGLAVTL